MRDRDIPHVVLFCEGGVQKRMVRGPKRVFVCLRPARGPRQDIKGWEGSWSRFTELIPPVDPVYKRIKLNSGIALPASMALSASVLCRPWLQQPQR